MITGIPTTVDIYDFEINLTDANNTSVTKILSIEIDDLSTTTLYIKNTPKLSIYPNPTNGTLYIDSYGKEIGKISIINYLGQVVHSQNALFVEIDLSDLQSGVYFIKIEVEGMIIN